MDAALTSARGRAGLDKPDRIGITAVLVVALCFAVTFLVLGGFDAIRTLIGSTVSIEADADARLLNLRGADLDGAVAYYDSARLMLPRIDLGARVLLALGGFLSALTTVAIAGAVAWLCRRLLRGSSTFTRALTRVTWFSAVTLIVLPAAARLLTDSGTNAAILQKGLHDPLLIGFGFDIIPVAAGVVLAIVGEVFRRGERLQRDVEGLV